ncbi:CoA-disulfide reductase [Bacillus songklensis]|uniref:CoA-disulfide reductase n=1 Tax=Bacillus songklensis TaxID=1069116 RepID=A0ABV8AZC2_9BACI
MERVLIIGGVAAGMSAASQLRRLNKSAEIIVFEKGEDVSYGACGLPYYISGVTKSHEDLIARTLIEFEERGIQVYTQHEVQQVDVHKREMIVLDVTKQKEKVYTYDKLLIATGASAILPPFVKAEFENVFTLKTLEDGKRMRAFFEKEQIERVTIIGGGYIGLELVETMLELGKSVRVVELNEQILTTLDADVAKIIQDTLRDRVDFHLGEEVQHLINDNNRVTAVKTDKGTYQTDAVIVNVGIRPNTQFVKDIGLNMLPNGAIIVNQFMETNIPHVYAAGDCATSHHLVLKKPVNIALGTIANKQGKLVGDNLAGQCRKFPGVLGTSVIKIVELEVAKTGVSEKEAKEAEIPYKTITVDANSHASYYPGAKRMTIKLVYHPETLVLYGAQMVGEKGVAKRIDVFATAVTNEMTTEEITLLDLSYAPPFASVWDAVQVATRKAK